MKQTQFRIVALVAGILLSVAGYVYFSDRGKADTGPAADIGYDPAEIAALEAAVKDNPMKDAYFGETHVHTSYSLDSFIGGNRNSPVEAYNFAKGSEMKLYGGMKKLKRPLDFLAVSDHSEYMGEMFSAQNQGAKGYENPMLEELRNLNSVDEQRAWFVKYVINNARGGNPQHPPFFAGVETFVSAWANNRKATNAAYEPGKFTTIHGFEWTASQNGGNMHRNVFFRDDNLPEIPFDSITSQDEEKLWDWIDGQRQSGRKLFAIPHNANGSKREMFNAATNVGQQFTAEYAKRRAAAEPLIEMMQIKANSEVHRDFWPNDEFADFENGNSVFTYSGRKKEKENFIRWAVIKGLDYQAKIGGNPFMYGFISATDNHNSGAGDTEEDTYIGSHGPADGNVTVRREDEIDGWIKGKDSNPGGLAGVWATSNTRADIWDAMASRETFATSGTRLKVRFFGGAGVKGRPKDANAMVADGYKNGVPMGGTLTGAKKAPTFTVYAQKDAIGANLDRIQIIKGWVDANGEPQERIIDVVWSGDRKRGANGRVGPVGSTVDLKTAAYTNTIGASVLMGSWTDDKFDPKQMAVYYVRVLEIPTPRWSTYDAVKNGLPLLPDVPATVQERAWSSPIWYTAKL